MFEIFQEKYYQQLSDFLEIKNPDLLILLEAREAALAVQRDDDLDAAKDLSQSVF